MPVLSEEVTKLNYLIESKTNQSSEDERKIWREEERIMSYYNKLKSHNNIIELQLPWDSMARSPEVHGREIVPAIQQQR